MQYDISVSDRETYLNVRVNEPVTEELLEDFLSEAAKKATEFGIDKFLFDLRRAHNRASELTYYNMVYKRSKQLGIKPGSTHALLVGLEDINAYRFVVTVLKNAGYSTKMFTDELWAIEWLEE
jgi:hypothetical protein